MIEVTAKNLTLDLPVYGYAGHRSLKRKVLSAITGGRLAADRQGHPQVRALDNVSFDLKEGDRLALIGHNGSGKTTLLRALAGIYYTKPSQLIVRGNVVPLLDVNFGMDPEASGYENILLRGLMLGFTKKQVATKTDEIAAFSGLGEFLNMPIRTYSSGMLLRLGFAISTSVEADILLMDEWLTVGDKAFAEKAEQRLLHLVNHTPILVMATHNIELAKKVCNRVVELEHGRIK